MSHIDKQPMQSHGRIAVIHQAVMQITGISLISTHKVSRKYDNQDGYITRIACSKMTKIIYKQENQH